MLYTTNASGVIRAIGHEGDEHFVIKTDIYI